MKRLLLITCSLLIVFAGAAAAWASCKQLSLASVKQYDAVPVHAHAHDHHADADHEHSRGTMFHCPTLDEFLLSATFSVRGNERVERLPDILTGDFDSQFAQPGSYPLIHGPPGSAQSRNIPRYLSLSVLRI